MKASSRGGPQPFMAEPRRVPVPGSTVVIEIPVDSVVSEVGGDALNGRSFEPAEIGRVEAGVLEEIEGLTTAAKRPGQVQGTLAMARLLDSPLNTAQHPQAMARLQAALDKLRKGADSRKSWLADVKKLTPRDGRDSAGRTR